ncbi:MAG: MarR family winged helix-turn-helix transcriptional regulator [Myxococcota bacterium]
MRDQFDGDRVILENALPFVIHGLYQQIRSNTYRAFHEHGLELTPEQWIVLVRLWERDRQSPSALSESTLRDRPTMTRILDTMQQNGLIVREVDEDDARARVICLTREAKALQKRLVPIAKRLVAQLENSIPQHDLEVTRRTLRRMFENIR